MAEIEVRIPVQMNDNLIRTRSLFRDYATVHYLTQQRRRVEEMFKVPKDQEVWMTVYDGKRNPVHIITSDKTRRKWHLYKMTDGKPSKVKTAASPTAFSEEIGFEL